jgi:hypothetical protein
MSSSHWLLLVIIQCVALAAGFLIGRARVHWGLRIGASILAATIAAAILPAIGVRWTFDSTLLHMAGAPALYAEGLPPTVPESALIGIAFVVLGVLCGRWTANR